MGRIRNKFENWGKMAQFRLIKHKLQFIPEKALVLAGDPRGGTTWLTEVLISSIKAALIWEPLWLNRDDTFEKIGFGYRQYIPEEENWSEAYEKFRELFSGHGLNDYLVSQTSISKLKQADYLLFKFCRANQLLPWLTNHFNFENPPIYLLRHPCAVVSSQLKQGGWDGFEPRYDIPDQPFIEHQLPDRAYVKSIDTVEKRLALQWCIANKITLDTPPSNQRWITVFYEDLLLDGENELKRILSNWKVPFAGDLMRNITQPSRTTVGDFDQIKGNSQVTRWQKELSPKQIADVLDVLKHFNITVYTNDPYPIKPRP